MAETIQVVGLRELDRAFVAADRALQQDFRDALEEAAAPVRSAAQGMAASSIRKVSPGDPWSRMRIGRQRGTVVYVEPVERGAKGRGNQRLRRPRFADLLMERALRPALVQNRAQVEERVSRLVAEVVNLWARV